MEGKEFERQVEQVLKAYVKKYGGHYHKNNALRLHSGKYIKGEPFDFEIFTKDIKAVFDTKSLNSEIWNIREKDFKQADNLLECKRAGLDAYFLVNFNGEIRQIDIVKFIEVISENRKNIKLKEVSEKWQIYQQLKK